MKKLKLNLLKLSAVFILSLGTIFFACKKVEHSNKEFENIIILGNSITYSPPNPQVGWYGNWGMAASAQEKDFVHLLMAKFTSHNSSAKVTYKNISQFEQEFWHYNLSNLDSLKALKPDLVILRIGENVDAGNVEVFEFRKHYFNLIEYFTKSGKTSVLCVSGFWKNDMVEAAIESSSLATNSSYVSLSSLDKNSYKALGLFSNTGVAIHPSDKGMEAIADIIWSEVLKL